MDRHGLFYFLGNFLTRYGVCGSHRLGVRSFCINILDLGLGFYDTEYRHTHNILVCRAFQCLVCEVGAVQRAGDRSILTGEVRIIHQRAATIGDEGVAFIGIGTCAHVRQEGDGLQGVQRLVKTNTVCGKRYRETVLGQRILQCKAEYRRCLRSCLVTGLLMVVLHLLIGIVGSIGLDDVLDHTKLTVIDVGGQYVDRHILGNRIVLLHLGLNRRGQVRVVGVLQIIEGIYLGVVELAVDLGQDLTLQTILGDHARNEVVRIGTTDGVLNTDTVFNFLNNDLTEFSGIGIGVVLLCGTVIGKVDDDLRK